MTIEAGLYQYLIANIPSASHNGQVNVDGTTVTWVSGQKFNTAWPGGQHITIDGNHRTIQGVTNDETLTINASLGTLTDVSYNSNNIYLGEAPNTTVKPYISYSRISAVRTYTMTRQTPLASALFRFRVYGISPASVVGVLGDLRSALSGYKGYMGAEWVDGCFLRGETDLGTQDTGGRGAAVDYEIFYYE